MSEPTLPAEGDDPRETGIIGKLRGLAGQFDPEPREVAEAARASFTWRTIDAELAELAYDSLLDEAGLAVLRSAEGPRLLTFEAPGLTVDVEVTALGAERRLVGQLVPPQAAELEVRHRGGVVSVQADDRGRFSAGGIAAGPASLVCRLPGGAAPVETDWIAL